MNKVVCVINEAQHMKHFKFATDMLCCGRGRMGLWKWPNEGMCSGCDAVRGTRGT